MLKIPFPETGKSGSKGEIRLLPIFTALLVLLFSGCIPPPAPEAPAPPQPPRKILVDTPASLAVRALLLDEDKKALGLARAIRNKQEREALLSLIRQRDIDRQVGRIRSDFSNGHRMEGALLLGTLQEKHPEKAMEIFLALRPEMLTWILLHDVREGKERLAIRTMNLLQPYKRTSFHPLMATAYSHWGFRRFWQGRYHDSFMLANQALSTDPANKSALSLKKRVLAIRDARVSRGLVAYRHQHLSKAIRLWKSALAIDPSNEETKKYILKAEELLKKIRHLEGQAGQSAPPASGGKK